MRPKFTRQFYAYTGDPADGGAAGGTAPATPPVTPPPSTPPADPKPADDPVKALQAQIDALTKYKTEAEAKKAEAAEAERVAKLTAEQKISEYEAEIAKTKRENLVIKLAAKKGLDPDLFDRVKGEDEASISADIELLTAKFKPAAPAPGEGATGGSTSGARTPSAATTETEGDEPDKVFANWLKGKLNI